MRVTAAKREHKPLLFAGPPALGGSSKSVGRFALHFLEMCAVMCVGAITLSVMFFGTAGLLGYTSLPQRSPVLTAAVIAVNLSLPMAAWMRFRGMPWRPTLEMSGSTMLAGLLLIAAYGSGLIDRESLMRLQTGLLACPLMLVVMLFRFRLYAGHQMHHARPVQTPETTDPVRR